MMKKMHELNLGEQGVIIKVEGEGRIRRRLFDMGVTPGAKVVFVKKAPLGDPIEIKIRGYDLTLRKEEAALVIIQIEGEK